MADNIASERRGSQTTVVQLTNVLANHNTLAEIESGLSQLGFGGLLTPAEIGALLEAGPDARAEQAREWAAELAEGVRAQPKAKAAEKKEQPPDSGLRGIASAFAEAAAKRPTVEDEGGGTILTAEEKRKLLDQDKQKRGSSALSAFAKQQVMPTALIEQLKKRQAQEAATKEPSGEPGSSG